ncbi:MAG TPA: multiheme c-type cytochrome [Candidatus Angelobacter sp.]|nr:multiheme c-type cytochrome [Candidatus Angelobacter sp.]
MSHASEPVGDAAPLRQHRELTFQLDPYKYSLVTDADKSLYSVSKGSQTLSQELGWAFGAGSLGQTFVYQQDGNFYESHLSYYSAIDGLDITIGHDRGIPPDLQHAAGRHIYAPETRRCFGCHTTASVTGNQLDLANLDQGVTCEACHGPGGDHVAAEKAGMPEAPGLAFNPGKLDRVDLVDFCGACHRSTADVIDGNFVEIGVMNVRFQPYRLQRSRCWEKGDARLTCTSCHDPHQPLQHDASDYDAACLRCHRTNPGAQNTADHPGTACKVGTKNCTSCHMPKYAIAGSHSSFTDHWIRVARAGETYPN